MRSNKDLPVGVSWDKTENISKISLKAKQAPDLVHVK